MGEKGKGARGSRNAVNLFARQLPSPPAPSRQFSAGAHEQTGPRAGPAFHYSTRYRGTIVELVGTRGRKRRIRLLPARFVPLDACLIESGAGSIVTRDLVSRLSPKSSPARISSAGRRSFLTERSRASVQVIRGRKFLPPCGKCSRRSSPCLAYLR